MEKMTKIRTENDCIKDILKEIDSQIKNFETHDRAEWDANTLKWTNLEFTVPEARLIGRILSEHINIPVKEYFEREKDDYFFAAPPWEWPNE